MQILNELKLRGDLINAYSSSGRVLIGSNAESSVDSGFSPMKSRLFLSGGDLNPIGLETVSNTFAAGFVGRKARSGTTAVQSGDVITGLFGRGYDTTSADWDSSGGFHGAFRVVAGSTFTSTNHETHMDWAVTASGSVTRAIRMFLHSSGRLTVGDSDQNPSGNFYAANGFFKNNLTVGHLSTASQGIDIGNSSNSGTSAFIDFHYGMNNSEDWNLRIINDGAGRLKFLNSASVLPFAIENATGTPGDGANVSFFRTGSYGNGNRVMFIGNATTVPDSNPSSGGILYTESGALKYRGSSGTVTTLGVA